MCDVIQSMEVPKLNQEHQRRSSDVVFLALTEKRAQIFEFTPCAKSSKDDKIFDLHARDLILVSS